MKNLIKRAHFTLNILLTPVRRLTCKHDWKCNGWTSVKCGKCGYVSRDINKASKVINDKITQIEQTPAAHTLSGLKNKAAMYYGR